MHEEIAATQRTAKSLTADLRRLCSGDQLGLRHYSARQPDRSQLETNLDESAKSHPRK